MAKSLCDWVEYRVSLDRSGRSFQEESLKQIELATHVTLDWSRGAYSAGTSLLKKAYSAQSEFLDVIDYLLAATKYPTSDSAAKALEEILATGGSIWMVWGEGEDRRLAERIARGSRDAVETAIAESQEAGSLLAQAWAEAYGRGPTPSASYDHSVKAVETAAHRVVTPRDPRPSLGKMIKAMRDAPSKWETVVGAKGADNIPAVVGMMDLLWTGHVRHGGAGGTVEATQEEAAAAVHLAATLVQWFARGALRRAK
jgi:hypothetical protein